MDEKETAREVQDWLTEKVPEFRNYLSDEMKKLWVQDMGGPEREYIPNITTDGLLEALATKGLRVVAFMLEDGERFVEVNGPMVSLHIETGHVTYATYAEAHGATLHEALCRAAKLALEAA